MRVFFDTNVLVSAVATRGICADLLRIVASEQELVVGEVVLTELRRVLEIRMRLPAERIDEVEKFLRTYEVVAKPDAMDPIVVRDEAVRWVLANARARPRPTCLLPATLIYWPWRPPQACTS